MMKKLGRALLTVLSIVSGAWLIIYLWPAKKRPKRAFDRADDPDVLNIAHRGGRGLAPEGTLTAFENASRLDVDMFEYDIHITKDGHLVVSHDATVNRTTDGVGWINRMTLEEVQALDAGYNFIDTKGHYSYRDQGVYIPTVAEVFERFPNMRHLIEIKDTNDVALYETAIQELWHLIQEYKMEDNVLVGSFNHDIIERFEAVTWGQIPIGAGEDEVRQFVTMHIPYLNGLAESNVDSLQLPTRAEGYDLTKENMIKGAKERNISLYYWTINDEQTMRELIAKGVDGIITDYPDRLRKVLVEVNAGI